MSAERKRRLVIELTLTGVASPLVIFLLALMGANQVLGLLAAPGILLGQLIGNWYDRVFPSEGWFGGLAPVALMDVASTWILIWIVLIAAVSLVERYIHQKREKA